jgi:hypothetical protein
MRSAAVILIGAMSLDSCGTASQSPERGDGPVTQPATATSEPAPSTQTTAEPEGEVRNPNPHDGQRPLSCTMAAQACPSSQLQRISTELDKAGWTRLRALAEQGVVAIVLGDRVEVLEACRLPGHYHEGVAAPDSPGRAWSSDRLVFVPDELSASGPKNKCDRATHFVASFAIRGDADGEAIVLPLPCPPLGTGKKAVGCVGAGLDDGARKAEVKTLWQQAEPLLDKLDMDPALPLALRMAALMPDAWGYMKLLDALRPLDRETHGGCLWLSEAAFAVHVLKPDHEISIVDVSKGRITPSHDYPICDTQPSLLTCFPGRFVPGTGDNCW